MCLGQWQAMYGSLVQAVAHPPAPAPKLAATVTVFTDPRVYYPVSWADALSATQAAAYDPVVLEAISTASFAYHVYTQMFKIRNASFSIEDGSLLAHLIGQ